ncbi:hypothetical protein [Caulobacter sp. HMWF025]|uniref:hypothetical protein n=2 Tax=unclassified Caulobacter TaxID=2648921 RepID=UPI000D3BE2EE|nr:hypothetical protein [Caulobacter sp. HMWF025]PTS81884.1 hypothetical protein DBR21_17930 [Caulobacter sp. HMWF009]PTT06704.1 hypothetical protein DBR10_11485 [Caulobacter sp. HMWF025]
MRTLDLWLRSCMAKLRKAFILSVALVLQPLSSSFAASPQPGTGEWSLTCIAGKDEFASNCEAVKLTPGWRLEINTGDSQLFLSVRAGVCPTVGEQSSWWRDEIAGLSAEKRAARLNQALEKMHRSVRRQCQSALSTGPSLDHFPDIAVHGDP